MSGLNLLDAANWSQIVPKLSHLAAVSIKKNEARIKIDEMPVIFLLLKPSQSTQGWKLLTVRLSGTGTNFGGQVKFLGTFPKESLKFCLF